MDRKEFFEWLETCPTHKWDITFESSLGEDGHVVVTFPIEEEEE
tara:strand:+ start:1241 stop:1372 length:132 start_codon:yes stop_codon:yes gene_type:complete